jgi:lipopolysaccharide transport system permease protein
MQTNRDDNSWDEVIEPSSSLFKLKLNEVWKYRDLMLLFVKRDFTAQYKQTVLGPIWHFVQPLFTTIIFVFIFSNVAGIDTDGIPPILFYMSNITIWNYFSSCLTATSNTFVANAGIFGKVYFPRLVLPLSVVLSNLVKLGIQFALLLIAIIWYAVKVGDFHFGASWLLMPILVIMLAGLGLGLGIIISSLTTKYRDFTVLIGFAVQLLMYVTPVAYPLSYLKSKGYAWIVAYNPVTPIVEAFRFSLFGVGDFTVMQLAASAIFILFVLFVGIITFNRVERSFMDTV